MWEAVERPYHHAVTPSPTQGATFATAAALHLQGRLAEAEAAYRQHLAEAPADATALAQLGLLLAQLNRLPEAETALRQALAIDPEAPDPLHNLGLVLQKLGRHTEAVDCYRALVARHPTAAEALLNLGNSYLELRQFEAAADAFREATRADPRSAVAFNNLGLALSGLQKNEEAVAAYEAASRAAPDYVNPLLNRAQLHLRQGQLVAAERQFSRALTIEPHMIEARRMLAQLHVLCGDIDAAVRERQQAIASSPDDPSLYRELVLDLNFADGDDGSRVLAACQDWHRRFADPVARRPTYTNDRDPDRRLRVAYVGNQFYKHTVSLNLMPLFEEHDPEQIELICYSDLAPDQEDEIAKRLKQLAGWRCTAGLADDALAETLKDDRVDVILDPVGFVHGSRLLALARHPAPIQASFPLMGTCGGSTIDYVIADELLLPEAARRFFTEKILRVPFAHCYRPLDELPPVTPLPAAASGTITFGTMNALPKLSPRALQVWRRILDWVPGSRLLLKAGFPFRDPQLRANFLVRLADAGIDQRRVILKEWQPEHRDHLAVLSEIDIALDSFPYGGVITTYEALAMGIPVVTRVGARVLDRYGYAILKTIGFDDGIAWTDDEYVARAVALAADHGRLEALRASLRAKLFASPACDGKAVAKSIELALRQAWRDWCSRR